jgi:hypothetical protein
MNNLELIFFVKSDGDLRYEYGVNDIVKMKIMFANEKTIWRKKHAMGRMENGIFRQLKDASGLPIYSETSACDNYLSFLNYFDRDKDFMELSCSLSGTHEDCIFGFDPKEDKILSKFVRNERRIEFCNPYAKNFNEIEETFKKFNPSADDSTFVNEPSVDRFNINSPTE